jgi:hypothetical protein
MNERREPTGLSRAGMAAGAEQRSTGPGTSPKYVEGEETAEMPRAPRTPTMATPEVRSAPLLPGNESGDFRSRWGEIQTGFVDEPRRAVEQADGLVAEVIKRVAETFAEERSKLESQWGRGDHLDTEGLRVALQRYRSFFERLLSS